MKEVKLLLLVFTSPFYLIHLPFLQGGVGPMGPTGGTGVKAETVRS